MDTFGEADPEPGGESEKKMLPGGSENECFFWGGCCDASDVIDAELCIISITRGSRGHVNCHYWGWEFASMRGKGRQGDVKSGWNSSHT